MTPSEGVAAATGSDTAGAEPDLLGIALTIAAEGLPVQRKQAPSHQRS